MKNIDVRNFNFKVKNYSIHNAIQQIDNKELLLQYYNGKKSTEWNNVQKSKYIESILIRAPVTPIILYNDFNNHIVIDGLNRLNALYEYMNNEFELTGLDFLLEFNNNKYSDFGRAFQRRIEETQIIIHVIECYNETGLANILINRYF